METQALYDLSPTWRLMLVGLLIASVPLLWLALKQRNATAAQRVRSLTLLTLFLTFDLVLFGAFTRLTDSGLGCPDWPGCYGNASPLGAVRDIAAAQTALPGGPVTEGKAWIEMIHRYLATGVGMLIVALAASAWSQRRRQRLAAAPAAAARTTAPGLVWPLLTLGWVCLQGAFGALTVTMKLFPAIVTLHLIGGLVLLSLLAAQASRQELAARDARARRLAPGLRALLWTALALVALQVALGGWVSTNYAVLACSSFPKCQGQWWPPADFSQGFELWRPLGRLADGSHISFAALTAIHMSHRLFAVPVLAVLCGLAWRLQRTAAMKRPARWIAGLALWQLATGLSNVLLGWPLAAAVAHTGGAAALVAVLSWTIAGSRGAAAQPAARVQVERLARAARNAGASP